MSNRGKIAKEDSNSGYTGEMIFGIIKHEISKKCTYYLQNGILSCLDTEIKILPSEEYVFSKYF